MIRLRSMKIVLILLLSTVVLYSHVLNFCSVNYDVARVENQCRELKPFSIKWNSCIVEYSKVKAKLDSLNFKKTNYLKKCMNLELLEKEKCLLNKENEFPSCFPQTITSGFSIEAMCLKAHKYLINECIPYLNIKNTVEFIEPEKDSVGPRIVACRRRSNELPKCVKLKIEVSKYIFIFI